MKNLGIILIAILVYALFIVAAGSGLDKSLDGKCEMLKVSAEKSGNHKSAEEFCNESR